MSDYLERASQHKTAYDRTAQEYFQRKHIFDENDRFLVETFARFLDRRIPRQGNEHSVLDVGVGSGLNLEQFEKLGYRTFGIDISEEMIRFARISSPNTIFYAGDFLTFPFDRKFSGVFAKEFIHLFTKEDAVKILDKMYEIREKNGLIYITTTIH